VSILRTFKLIATIAERTQLTVYKYRSVPVRKQMVPRRCINTENSEEETCQDIVKCESRQHMAVWVRGL
jgi:hypothetical protein